MQRVDVVYLYEHVAREIDVACAVRVLCEQRHGLRVELVQWPYGIEAATQRFRPRLVVLPFCYEAGHFTDVLLHWGQSAFLNLAWEQLLYKGNSALKLPKDRFATQHVIHHAWSEEYAAALIQLGIPAPHVVLNGQPAYGLYAEPYRGHFTKREKLASALGLDPGAAWVFFPENYNWMFYGPDRIDEFARRGGNLTTMKEMQEFSERSFGEVLRWCAAAAELGNVEIIIRPRPATSVDMFNAAVERVLWKSFAHLHIRKDGTVREWILASDAVVSSTSTSLIEAAIAGKPAYMLEPVNFPAALGAFWHDLLPHLQDKHAFLEVCLRQTESTDTRLRSWAQSTLLGQGDPIANVAQLLAGMANGVIARAPGAELSTSMVSANHSLPGWLLYAYRRLRYLVQGRNPRPPGNAAYESDLISAEDLEKRVDQWRRTLSLSTVS